MSVYYYVSILQGVKKETATKFINQAVEKFNVNEDELTDVLYDMDALKSNYNGDILVLGYELESIGDEETAWEMEMYDEDAINDTVKDTLTQWRNFFDTENIVNDAAMWVYEQALTYGSVLISGRWS